tara:strand:+ start:1435 stop:1809 length:375 start_codon:yes stop_codon:yes gene_type:complete
MAQTKLFAPEGFHFMITSKKGFYIMKDPVTGYTKHTLRNGDFSSKHVTIEYPLNHKNVADVFHYTTLTESLSYKPKKSKKTRVISQPKPDAPSTRPVRTIRVSSSSGGSSGGSSSSGGSGGGGY